MSQERLHHDTELDRLMRMNERAKRRRHERYDRIKEDHRKLQR